jgi:hypothetical protein
MSDTTLLEKMDSRNSLSHEVYGVGSLCEYQALVDASLKKGAPVLKYVHEGRGDKEDTLKRLTTLFGQPVSIRENDDSMQYVFVDDVSYLGLMIGFTILEDKHYIELELVTTEQKTFDEIKNKFKGLLQNKPTSNSVLALVSTKGSLGLSTIGQFTQKLSTHNYSSLVLEGYEHVKACLSSKTPCGRLVLFQGAPGTGKSYMIRSLVSTIDSTFIVVGSNMIADLSGPSILPVLMGAVQHGKPITFILEDADVALSDRKSAGMSQLSGLLNLGDGLLGEMMDIRIVATTNAGKLELDKAVTRPGRMCQHLTFDALSANDANSLYTKLVSGEAPGKCTTKPLTLAEVYRLARRDGWVAPKPNTTQGTYI